MDTIWNFIVNNAAFFTGLALGLLITFFTWKSSLSAKSNLKKEVKRVGAECRELQSHLNTQLKINAEGNDSLQKKIEQLKEQNENLRVNLNTLQNKPGRHEVRQLHLIETAVSYMREQAPGFAPAWEQALRKAEAEQEAAEGGLKKLVRKVIPSLSYSGGDHDDDSERDSKEKS